MTEKEPRPQVVFQVQSRSRLGSRAVLLAGFGALLILMAIICIDSPHTLGEFQTANTQIRQDFLYREHTLEQVRTGLYESGNIVREYILIETLRSEMDENQAVIAALALRLAWVVGEVVVGGVLTALGPLIPRHPQP